MEKRNVYKGHRYVPKIMGEWEQTETYEGLSIVTYQGTSYTSKKMVPVGIDILNEEYWAVTGNYNAQVEYYRQEVREYDGRISDNKQDIEDNKQDILDNKQDIEGNKQSIENTNAQLAKTATDIFNANSLPNLQSDFAGTIKQAFLEHDKVFVPKKDYFLTEELRIPERKSLDLGGSTLFYQNDNASVVIERNGFLDNFNLDVSDLNGYTGKALVIDGSKRHSTISNTEIGKGSIRNTSTSTGTALFLDATIQGSAIVNLKIENLRIYGFKYGVYGDSTLTGTYINGNNLDNISFYDCDTFIYLDGEGGTGMDNNTMDNIYIQPGNNSKLGVYIAGHRNHFKGSLWDMGHFPDMIGFEFSPLARENKIVTEGGQSQIKGNNGMNTINGLYGGVNQNIYVTGAGKVQSGDTRRNLYNYIGKQDNVIANADKKYSVDIEGKQPNNLSHMFSTNPNNYSTFMDLTENDSIKITIDLSNDPLRQTSVIGAIFVFMSTPDYIKIEVERPSGNIITVFEEDNFTGGYVSAPITIDQANKIHYTFTKKEGSRIDVSKLFAGGLGTKGNHFIDTSGGDIYGNLTFDQGNSVVIKSPNGSDFILRVNDSGELTTVSL